MPQNISTKIANYPQSATSHLQNQHKKARGHSRRLHPLTIRVWCGLRALCFGQGFHVDVTTAFLTGGEYHCAVNECVDCVVATQADIFAGMVHGTALALDDVTGLACLTAKYFHAETLAF